MSFSALKRRALDAVRAYFRQEMNYEDLTNFGEVSPNIHRHLRMVYATLNASQASLVLGYTWHLYNGFGGLQTIYGLIQSCAWFYLTPPTPGVELERILSLAFAAFFLGKCIGPLIGLFFTNDQRTIFTFMEAASVVCQCFCFGSLLTERRRVAYAFSIISSVVIDLTTRVVVSAACTGDFCSDVWSFKSYPVFICCILYMLAYSQYMVAQARRRHIYFTQHALGLFTYFPAVCYHIGFILLKKAFGLGRVPPRRDN